MSSKVIHCSVAWPTYPPGGKQILVFLRFLFYDCYSNILVNKVMFGPGPYS